MHFLTVVLVPKTVPVDQIEAKVTEMLKPFDERKEVTPYKVECDCINSKAANYARDMADRLDRPLDAYRKEIRELPNDTRPGWKEFTKSWWVVHDEYEKSHELYQKPTPDCEDCLGTGIDLSTYNPKSKWDWWRIGGRYDGCVTENRRESDDGFNFDKKHQELGNNLIAVSDLPDGYTLCYAILTPDGEWIDRDIREVSELNPRSDYKGRIPDDEWNAKLHAVFAKYTDCYAVGCDMHM